MSVHASATCCEAYTFPTSHIASCGAWAHAVTCGLHAQVQALENMTHISFEGAHELFMSQCMLGPLAVRSVLYNAIHDLLCVHGHMQSLLDFMHTARQVGGALHLHACQVLAMRCCRTAYGDRAGDFAV